MLHSSVHNSKCYTLTSKDIPNSVEANQIYDKGRCTYFRTMHINLLKPSSFFTYHQV
jgi:hypothetical protein